MMYHEFLDRTGINVTIGEYEEVIEQMYYDFDGNKDEFCKDFVKNNRIAYTNRFAVFVTDVNGYLLCCVHVSFTAFSRSAFFLRSFRRE